MPLVFIEAGSVQRTTMRRLSSSRKTKPSVLRDRWKMSEGDFMSKALLWRGPPPPKHGIMFTDGTLYAVSREVRESSCCIGTPRATEAIRSDRFKNGLPSPEELIASCPNRGEWLASARGQTYVDEIGKLNPEWIEWLMGYPNLWSRAVGDILTQVDPSRRSECL